YLHGAALMPTPVLLGTAEGHTDGSAPITLDLPFGLHWFDWLFVVYAGSVMPGIVYPGVAPGEATTDQAVWSYAEAASSVGATVLYWRRYEGKGEPLVLDHAPTISNPDWVGFAKLYAFRDGGRWKEYSLGSGLYGGDQEVRRVNYWQVSLPQPAFGIYHAVAFTRFDGGQWDDGVTHDWQLDHESQLMMTSRGPNRWSGHGGPFGAGTTFAPIGAAYPPLAGANWAESVYVRNRYTNDGNWLSRLLWVDYAAPTKLNMGLSATATEASLGGTSVVTATLSVSTGPTPTGTLTFRLYGPDATDCAPGQPLVTEVQMVANRLGDYQAEGLVTEPGRYAWYVAYSGDDVYNAAATVCGAENLTFSVYGLPPAPATTRCGPPWPPASAMNPECRLRARVGGLW
ncbi:MAG: hypothetical protein M3144_04300, partial [Actinomycetota bacterium]|nr:hypothetical protein [Actinomycetota bacterium]